MNMKKNYFNFNSKLNTLIQGFRLKLEHTQERNNE